VVPLGSRGECRISLDELGRVRDGLVAEGVRLQLRGAVAVKAGYLRLELFAEGALGSRRVRSLLTGVGDARCGHA